MASRGSNRVVVEGPLLSQKLAYDEYVKRLKSATVAVLAAIVPGLLFAVPGAAAQINGTPSSVTSSNFGGHLNSTPGVPASVTSLGTSGLHPRNPGFNQPCCINPLFPSNPNHIIPRHRQHQRGQFFPGGGAVYIPYAYPVVGESDLSDSGDQQEAQSDEEAYRGGPTIFDRRGSGQPARAPAGFLSQRPTLEQRETEPPPALQTDEAPVPDQPQTVLMFKDGHKLEVQNYAVIGDTLYDLTPGRHHKILLSELDLSATAKQNDDRDVDFRLPPKPEATN
jgi:hypothetical protein